MDLLTALPVLTEQERRSRIVARASLNIKPCPRCDGALLHKRMRDGQFCPLYRDRSTLQAIAGNF